MKQLVCEMCGGTDLIKQDGVFVCQSCGCKYSVEEAKKMMVEGTVEVTGTVKVDNTDAIDNYLKMATSAIAGKNSDSANNYADKALELDPSNATAWWIKMQAAAISATVGDCKVSEQVVAGKNAIRFTKGEVIEVEKMEMVVYSHFLGRAELYFQLAANAANNNHAQLKQAYNAAIRANGWTASDRIANLDSNNISQITKLAGEAANIGGNVPDEAYGKYPELTSLASRCASQARRFKEAMIARVKVYGRHYNDGGAAFDTAVRYFEDKASNGRRRYESERVPELEKRRKDYWEAHAEQKKEFEDKLEALSLEKRETEEKKKAVEKEIRDIQSEVSVDYTEYRNLCDRVSELEREKDALGMFKGKEKKRLQEQIDAIKTERDAVERANKDKMQEMQKAIEPRKKEAESRRDSFSKRIDEINKEVRSINEELKKDR